MTHTEIKVNYLPKCDVCQLHYNENADAHYDGRTQSGEWAYMCEDCFKVHGVGLGLGKGQRLIVRR